MTRFVSLYHDNHLINNHLELTVNLAPIAPGTPDWARLRASWQLHQDTVVREGALLSGGAAEVVRICHSVLRLYRGTAKLSTPLPLNRPCRRGLHPRQHENSPLRHLRRNRVACGIEQNPQSARRNNFPGKQISRWFLLLSEKLSASHYPGAAIDWSGGDWGYSVIWRADGFAPRPHLRHPWEERTRL